MSKRIFALLLALLLCLSTLLSFASCGEEKPKDDGKQNGEQENGNTTVPSGSGNPSTTTPSGSNSSTPSNPSNPGGSQQTNPPASSEVNFPNEPTAGLEYRLNGDETAYTLVGKGSAKAEELAYLHIASVYEGLPVTAIAANAFNGCTDLKAVKLPTSIAAIGSQAFRGCSNLVALFIDDLTAWCEIEFEDRALYYGADLYVKNNRLTELVIPEGLTEIKAYSFCRITSITSVTVGSGVTAIGKGAFYGCTGLTAVNLPAHRLALDGNPFSDSGLPCEADGSLYVGEYLLRASSSETAYSIKAGTKYICDDAFFSCSMPSVNIPASVTFVAKNAFRECSGLESVNITDIGAWCNIEFEYDPEDLYRYFPTEQAEKLTLNSAAITELTVPEGVNKIPPFAFSSCKELTRVSIPNSVTEIGDYAFADCGTLGAVTFGTQSQLRRIGTGAFGYYDEGYCEQLATFDIPDSVTSIGHGAFPYCEKIITVVDRVEYIDGWAVGLDDSQSSRYTIAEGTVGLSDGVLLAAGTYGNASRFTLPVSLKYIGSKVITKQIGTSRIQITYAGTVEQWNAIQKAGDWLTGSGYEESIVCVDGTIGYQG